MPPTALIHKNLGETPLEALERFRNEKVRLDTKNSDSWKTVPMTYAGRLDPMAEGALLILIGDECKNKEKYLGLDKEYEVEMLLGVSTDTHDILGISFVDDAWHQFPDIDFSKYIGTFTQEYPPYSSKTVNGKQLHELARTNGLPEEMPTKDVEIYSISEIMPKMTITAGELMARMLGAIELVKGDFRQNEIKGKWKDVLSHSQRLFDVITLRVKCSSGTYMRSLADRIGKDGDSRAMALSIKRTEIFCDNMIV